MLRWILFETTSDQEHANLIDKCYFSRSFIFYFDQTCRKHDFLTLFQTLEQYDDPTGNKKTSVLDKKEESSQDHCDTSTDATE